MTLHHCHRAFKQTQVSNLYVQPTAQTQEWAQEHFTSSLGLQTTSMVIIRRRSNYDDMLSQGSNTQQRQCMENLGLSQTMLNTERQNQITVFHAHKIQKQILQCQISLVGKMKPWRTFLFLTVQETFLTYFQFCFECHGQDSNVFMSLSVISDISS